MVIVNYCSGTLLRDQARHLCVNSLIELVVVDNASTDDSIALAEEALGSARLVLNRENVGFAAAVNQGVKMATTPYVCLLNPDTVVSAESLLLLVDTIERRSEFGVVAPIVEHPKGIRVMEAGWEPSLRHMFMHMSGLSRYSGRFPSLRGFHSYPSESNTEIVELDWVSGAVLVASKAVWDLLGGLDERWFMYTEDVEFCRRVRQSGRSVGVVSAVRASHAVGGSVDEDASGSASANTRTERPTDTLWVTTLYQHYRDDLADSRFLPHVWAMVVGLGLLARAGAFRFQAAAEVDARLRAHNIFMAKKFWWSFRALLRAVGAKE
ncbi:glycosyltransferase family 2 protein [Gordonia amicalis]|uniref:glycosyltransferase family 2 protein n=1 Tax=Gordonia amicalis TaxID=89053 RepID=UPI002954D269|nr:glycosyltransferase family 2 protein [Gordonia amicalis]MDV7102421.1 glycosyltransferase family 2 protein [Gordonia amicalis]